MYEFSQNQTVKSNNEILARKISERNPVEIKVEGLMKYH